MTKKHNRIAIKWELFNVNSVKDTEAIPHTSNHFAVDGVLHIVHQLHLGIVALEGYNVRLEFSNRKKMKATHYL